MYERVHSLRAIVVYCLYSIQTLHAYAKCQVPTMSLQLYMLTVFDQIRRYEVLISRDICHILYSVHIQLLKKHVVNDPNIQ